MGMSAHGELTELTKQVRPHIAIISNIEPVHLEFFSSLKDIAKAKAEIFTGVEDGGFAILNKDNDLFTYLAELATASNIKNVLSFGEDEKADARLISYTESEHSCLIKADILGKIISYRLGCSGIHQARNSLAVLLAVAAAEEDIVSSAETLQEFSALKGRGKIYNLAKNNLEYFLIDDSYNAGPASIKAALKVLGTCQAKTGRRVAILADMRELGPSSVEFHKDLATDIINNNIDQVICVGNMMRHLYDILPQNKKLAAFANVNEVIPEIYHYLKNKDMVLVKGSLGTGIFKLVEHLIK
jgi:UDP-N-acetylmuramoyl-tripeptide--D-alanyl-D-alanine ligase